MFQKLMASVGIGAAKVDTILTTEELYQGAEVEGRVEITGGAIEQRIDAIKLQLMTLVKKEVNDSKIHSSHVIAEYAITDSRTIQPGEQLSLPFKFTLHPETPITALPLYNNSCKVWLHTSLDIDNAIDPTDKDVINVHPLPVVKRVLEMLTQQGVQLVKADVEAGYLKGRDIRSTTGFYQEIELASGGFISRQEIELSFILDGGLVRCLVELDRGLGYSDSYREFALPLNADDQQIRQVLSRLGA